MSVAQITLTDTDEGVDVEVKLSDRNAESSAILMGTYISQNWDQIVAALKRHLIVRQAMLNEKGEVPKDELELASPAPKILNADGTGTLSSEE